MKEIITDNAELTLSQIPLPKDTNMQDVIFGGWTLQKLDLAGSVLARRLANETNERVVTKAINHVEFIAPIHIGDKVDFYSQVHRIGNSSITVHIRVEAERYTDSRIELVCEAEFVYVKLPQLEDASL